MLDNEQESCNFCLLNVINLINLTIIIHLNIKKNKKCLILTNTIRKLDNYYKS
jgi:hypothetical protein